MLLDVEVMRDVDAHLHDEPPSLPLWHYTTMEAAVAVLQSKTVRLGCHVGMNDPSEGTIGSVVVKDSWNSFLDVAGLPAEHQEYLRTLPDVFESYFDYGKRKEVPPTFIFSLTELRDSLSQWARYGGDGAGVAIGFRVDSRKLPGEQAKPWATGTKLSRVRYDEASREELRPFLTNVVRKHFDSKQDADSWENTLLTVVHALNPLLKLGPYHEEKEWRIVTRTVIESVELYDIRANEYGISPYVELPFGESLEVAEVMLGPKLAPHNQWTAEWLCKKCGHDAPPVSEKLPPELT